MKLPYKTDSYTIFRVEEKRGGVIEKGYKVIFHRGKMAGHSGNDYQLSCLRDWIREMGY
jgi:hypothetical protein